MTVSGLVGGVLYGSVVRRFGRQVIRPLNCFSYPTQIVVMSFMARDCRHGISQVDLIFPKGRYDLIWQVEGVKVSYALSSVSCIGLLLCLRLPDVFVIIIIIIIITIITIIRSLASSCSLLSSLASSGSPPSRFFSSSQLRALFPWIRSSRR